MRSCLPLASASEPLAKDPPSVRSGGSRALAFAAITAAVWLAPIESSAQHFYAGLGAGLERPPKTESADSGCSGAGPASRYGCETGGGPAPIRIFRDPIAAPALEPIARSAAAGIPQIERLAEERAEFESGDAVESAAPEKRRSLSRFIAPSFDMPAFGAPAQGALSPFLGGGMGTVRTGGGETSISSWDTGRFVPGASKVGTAWMVTAGVAAILSARTTVELSWRYNHLGEPKTGRGSGRVEWRDRGRPIPTNLAPTSAEAKSHGVRVSLHYGF